MIHTNVSFLSHKWHTQKSQVMRINAANGPPPHLIGWLFSSMCLACHLGVSFSKMFSTCHVPSNQVDVVALDIRSDRQRDGGGKFLTLTKRCWQIWALRCEVVASCGGVPSWLYLNSCLTHIQHKSHWVCRQNVKSDPHQICSDKFVNHIGVSGNWSTIKMSSPGDRDCDVTLCGLVTTQFVVFLLVI